MRNVYIILPRSETNIARIARTVTGYPYSHVTISLDDRLEVFYSFSRIYNDAPFISGFVKEYRSHLASKKNVNLSCKIFKIPVSDRAYQNIIRFIKSVARDPRLMFNYFSMATLPILKGFDVCGSYNCCAFAAEVLQRTEVVKLHKATYKFFPKDFDDLLSEKYLFFQGELNAKKQYPDEHYFDKVPLDENIVKSAYSLYESLYRIIFKKISKTDKKSWRMIRTKGEKKSDRIL